MPHLIINPESRETHALYKKKRMGHSTTSKAHAEMFEKPPRFQKPTMPLRAQQELTRR